MATAQIEFKTVGGDVDSRDIGYLVKDATSDIDALAAAEAAAPGTYDGMPLINLQVEEIAWPAAWRIVAQYSRQTYERPETDQLDYQFDFSLGSQKIVQSRSTIAKFPTSGATDFGGAINVDSGGRAQGVDIRVPQSTFSYAWFPATATVTSAYQVKVQELVGKVNSLAWHGYEAGEVLFVGASGRARNNEDWEISYKFEYRPNQTGLTIGTIPGIDVDGWDLLWVYYGLEADGVAGRFIELPKQVNVERVYERDAFATELGF